MRNILNMISINKERYQMSEECVFEQINEIYNHLLWQFLDKDGIFQTILLHINYCYFFSTIQQSLRHKLFLNLPTFQIVLFYDYCLTCPFLVLWCILSFLPVLGDVLGTLLLSLVLYLIHNCCCLNSQEENLGWNHQFQINFLSECTTKIRR